MKCGDEGGGAQAQESLSTISCEVNRTEILQQAVQREKDWSRKMMEQETGNTQHSVKSEGMEP